MGKTLSYAEGRLVLTADRLTLTRGKRTAFSTPLQEIREATIEQATAFAHPRLGLAFGLALLRAGWSVGDYGTATRRKRRAAP